MHGWTTIFGTSPVVLRLPSALAMAAGACVTTALGVRLFGRRAAIGAGLLLAGLPVVSKYGQEARPYALTLLVAVTATLLLVQNLDRSRPWRWAVYLVLLLVLGLLQLTALLLVAAHGVAVLVRCRRERDHRLLVAWLIVVGVVATGMTPVLMLAMQQTYQVPWIDELSWRRAAELPATLFSSPLVAGAVIVLALLAASRHGGAGALCLAIALLPVAVLTLISVEVPLLVGRYLLYTVVGWVLLAGAALARAGIRESATALAVLLVLGTPAQWEIRSATKNHQPDYRTMAQIMEGNMRAGDAVVMPRDRGWRLRMALQVYLPPSSRPEDVLETAGPAATGTFDGVQCENATCLGDPPRIWLGCLRQCDEPLSSYETGVSPALRELITSKGYRQERLWPVRNGAIAVYSR
jgi:mannosyltransferase